MQYISLYGFWWVFGNDFFKFFKRRNVWDFPHVAQAQLRSQTHVAQSHDAPQLVLDHMKERRTVLGRVSGDVFLKRSKKKGTSRFKIHGGGLGKVDCRSDMMFHDMSWYFSISFFDISWFTDVWRCLVALHLIDLLDDLLVTLSWNNWRFIGVSSGAVETSVAEDKRKYSTWCTHLCTYINV